MNPPSASSMRSSVSNLMPVWDGSGASDAGSYQPEAAPIVVAQVVSTPPAPAPTQLPAVPTRRVAAPERFDASVEPAAPRSAFTYELLHGEDDLMGPDDAPIELDDARERRSAFEISFLMISAALSILLAAPPLVQILLAAHGTQA